MLVKVIKVHAKNPRIDPAFVGGVTEDRTPLNVKEILVLNNPYDKQSSIIAVDPIVRVIVNNGSLQFIAGRRYFRFLPEVEGWKGSRIQGQVLSGQEHFFTRPHPGEVPSRISDHEIIRQLSLGCKDQYR